MPVLPQKQDARNSCRTCFTQMETSCSKRSNWRRKAIFSSNNKRLLQKNKIRSFGCVDSCNCRWAFGVPVVKEFERKGRRWFKHPMLTLKVLLKDSETVCFHDILEKVKSVSPEEKNMITKIFFICKLLYINPATSATRERSFSTARILRTQLRATMTQKRFNSLAVLNIHISTELIN